MPGRRETPSTSRRRRIPILTAVLGLFGGTFDPPHLGHLAVASAALDQLGIDEVRFVPAGEPWQKANRTLSAAHHRLAMVELAAEDDDRFVVDDLEIRRSGPSYTIDTVRELGPPLTLILGADAAAGIASWDRAEDLLDLVELAVIPRPGVDMDEVLASVPGTLRPLSMPTIDLSATEIRAHVRAGYSPRYLVPDRVAEYIVDNGLYRRPGTMPDRRSNIGRR